MPYYFLNRCTENELSELDLFAEELGLLKSAGGESEGRYQWDGKYENFQSLRHNKGLMHLIYNSSNGEWPLSVQTLSVLEKEYKDPHINMVIRRLISITNFTAVSDSQVDIIDMSFFER